MAEFEIGDVVCLKSGGPEMTVDQVFSDGKVYCVWFDEDDEKQGARFSEESLEEVDDE